MTVGANADLKDAGGKIAKKCCCEDLVIDPEILELKEQLKRLQRNVYRLSSLIKMEEQVREPKETRKIEIEEDEK